MKKKLFSYLTYNQILAKYAMDHCHFGYNKKAANKNTVIDVYHFNFFFGLENIESSPKQKKSMGFMDGGCCHVSHKNKIKLQNSEIRHKRKSIGLGG